MGWLQSFYGTFPMKKTPQRAARRTETPSRAEAASATIAEPAEPETLVTTPWSMKRHGSVVLVKVTLHRGMPSAHINLEPTKTHFYLDTLKNSMKIRVGPTPFPDNVEVDPEAAEASMEGGCLQ